MKKSIFLAVWVLVLYSTAFAQQGEDIVTIIDGLTIQWDSEAIKLETHDGFQNYCRNKAYRDNTILLLDHIHHYDTTLYFTVAAKYDLKNEPEAKATLEDIERLEVDYTTRSFLSFLRQECMQFNNIEMNKSSEDYEEQMSRLEAELTRYIGAITRRIDLIDEHVHHLKDL